MSRSLLFLLIAACTIALPSHAQDSQAKRKVKLRISPNYPDIARRMQLGGTVRLVVEVSPGGAVKSSRAMGGSPVLVMAAQDAVKGWKFEPETETTTEVVEFVFKPGQ